MAVVRLSLHKALFLHESAARARILHYTQRCIHYVDTLRLFSQCVALIVSLAHSRQFLFSTHSSPHTRDASATVHTTLSRCPTFMQAPARSPRPLSNLKRRRPYPLPPHTKNSLVAHDIELYCSWLSERNESTCETYTSKLLPGRITTPVRAVPSTTISSGASVWMCRTYCVP